MKCEISVITMTPLRLDYLVHGPDNCVDDTPTETGLKPCSLLFQHRLFDGDDLINHGEVLNYLYLLLSISIPSLSSYIYIYILSITKNLFSFLALAASLKTIVYPYVSQHYCFH